MRAWVNISATILSVWSNGRNALLAAFRRQTCASAFIMRVSGVASKPWGIRRKARNA